MSQQSGNLGVECVELLDDAVKAGLMTEEQLTHIAFHAVGHALSSLRDPAQHNPRTKWAKSYMGFAMAVNVADDPENMTQRIDMVGAEGLELVHALLRRRVTRPDGFDHITIFPPEKDGRQRIHLLCK